MAWTLCQKADVIAVHPTTEAVLQDLWSDLVEAMIKEYLGEENLGTQTNVVGELHDGNRSPVMLVSRPPILHVDAVYVNGVYIQPSDYVNDSLSVTLLNQLYPEGIRNVSLSYASGSLDDGTGSPIISPIVRFTAVAMIVAILQYRGRFGADSSIRWGTVETKEGAETPTVNIGLTSHLTTIMKRMLRRTKIRVR